MMRNFVALCAGLTVAASLFGQPTEGRRGPRGVGYLDAKSVDYASVVPPVPVAGSLADTTDLEVLLRVQGLRSDADAKWANDVLKTDVFSNADIVGAWFAKDSLPATDALFKKSGLDAGDVTNVAKDFYKRTRPYTVNPEIVPCVPKPGGYSYPSGYAMTVFVRAGVLAALFPDKSAEIFSRARSNAWARCVGGVHYPTDIVAGRMLAELVVADLLKNPAFQADLEKARAELKSVSAK
jgi:acid phosphatase (class A)